MLPAGERIKCGEYAADLLARMESGALRTKQGRPFKSSSIAEARGALRRFTAEFGDRPLAGIERREAIRWTENVPGHVVQIVVTLFGRALDEELIDRSPFRKLSWRTAGRS